MAGYLVLARKYRSATFDEVVGQEHIARTLKNAIAGGRIAHAFLFVGTRGVGKTTMARILAKALNCLKSDGPTNQPCNACDACVAIARGDDLDVLEIDGASNRGIDEIRQLRANAIYRPARTRYKIYYIDEVHMLTKEAFNALLKTLEEPPEHVKFIFATTEPEKLPATIVSRCQRFDFRNIPIRQIDQHLRQVCKAEKVKADDDALFRIARSAAGSMRDALSLLDQLLSAGGGQVTEDDVLRVLGTPSEEKTASIVAAVAANNAGQALSGLDALLASGITLESAVGAIGEMFRHMMLILVCGPDSDLVELPESQRKSVAELAAKFTLPAVVQAVTLCQITARGLHGLTSGRALAEAAVVRLAAADKFVDAASLVERLERLSAGAGAPAGSGRVAAAGPPRYGGAPPSAGRYPAPGAPGSPRPPGSADEKKKDLTEAANAIERVGRPPAAGETADGAAAGRYVGSASGAAGPPAPGSTGSGQTPSALAFEFEFLKGHWADVGGALVRERMGHLAGLLMPARVQAVEGDTLKLGYDAAHDALRQRAEKADQTISPALSRVFGRPVRCKYMPSGQEGKPLAAGRAAPATASLSTAERAEITNDPAIKGVLELFEGSVVDIRKAPVPPADEPGQ